MNIASLWLEAGMTLVDRPTESILCPNCSKDSLIVFDTAGPTGFESEMVDRYLVCPTCKSYNVMLMKRREEQREVVPELEGPIVISEVLTILENRE